MRGPRGRARSGRRSRRPSRFAPRRSSPARGPGRRPPGRRVAVADNAAQGRHPAAHRAAAVGVVGEEVARLADPARRRGEGPVLRVAEDRHRLPSTGSTSVSGGAPRPATRSTATSSRASKATTAASRNSPSPRSTRASFIPATTWAFVTTRFGAATQPEPSMPRPHAVPVTRKTLGRAASTPGALEQLRVGRRDPRQRPADGGERVDARDRVEQPRRRHSLVDLAEDARALHLLAQLRLARVCAARTAPATQTIAAPAAAPSTSPPTVSSTRSGGTTKSVLRIELPATAADALDERGPARPPRRVRRAACRATRSRTGTAARAWRRGTRRRRSRRARRRRATSPRRSPFSAASPITAAAIQSTVATVPPYGPPTRRLQCPSPWGA